MFFISFFGLCIFFRDPDRVVPVGEGIVVSPADGEIISVCRASVPDYIQIDGSYKRISIFMSPVDVHVNRIPISGKVLRTLTRMGNFDMAYKHDAINNFQKCTVIETEKESKLACVQIAGFLTRRIVTRMKEGMDVLTGQRYGMIEFGSRVDLYIPSDVKIMVCAGQRVVGGETVVANMGIQGDDIQGQVK